MNMRNLIYVLLGIALCVSCREDELVVLSDTQDTDTCYWRDCRDVCAV